MRRDPTALSRVLRTKLAPPPLPDPFVPRPRLWSTMDRALQRRLVLVAAPAGSGKTVALASWIEQHGEIECAWLSLDEADNDLVRFWTHVVAAVQLVAPGVGDAAMALLDESHGALDDRAVISFGNDLVAVAEPRDAVLVLDDAHFLATDEAHHALAEVVHLAPAWLRVVISTRAESFLPMPRLRARDDVFEIGIDELRFSREETASLVTTAGVDDVSGDDLSALVARTEGWPAGLRLAVTELQHGRDPPAVVAELSVGDAGVSDYLVAEVFDRETPDVQDFLMETAVLDVLAPAVCDAVTGRTDSAEALVRLAGDNVFLIPVEGYRRFRYHQLFRDFLICELRSRAPDRERLAHERAGDWYEGHGELPRAVDHRIAAGQHARALALVRDAVESSRDAGQLPVARDWLRAIPPLEVSGDAWGMVDHAAVLGSIAQDDELVAALDAIEALLVDAPDPVASVREHVLRAGVANFRADGAGAVRHLQAAVDLLRDPLVADDPRLRALGLASRLRALLIGAWEQLEEFDQAREVADAFTVGVADDGSDLLLRAIALAHAAYGEGHLREADRLVRNATGRTRVAHFSPHRGELLGIRLLAGALESERNDLDVADSSLSGAVVAAAADYPPGNRYHVRGVVELAKVRVAQGRADEALGLVADLAGDTSVSLSPLARAWVDGFRAVVLAATGRTDAACELAETLPDLPSCVVVSGRVALAAGHLDRAAACASAVPLDTPRREIEARLLRASVLGTSGEDHLAADELQRAVAIASTEGFVRTLLDFSPMVDALLARLPVGPVEYVESLRQAAEARSTVIDLRSPAELVDPLSARELEVLAYLPTRLSTRQIAAELYISLNTLKTHVSAIYRKLDASSRSEAVLKARGVGLLR